MTTPSFLSHLIFNHNCDGVCPHNSCILSILRGARNGAIYGCKIRFPHALVMTLLFKDGTWRDKCDSIFQATFQHSKNLAIYVTIYKSILCLCRHLRGFNSPLNTLIAGAIGGYIVFGDDNPLNQQINMYLFSRVCFGLARLVYEKNHEQGLLSYVPTSTVFPIFSALCWALVMYLHEYHGQHLQKSLVQSMNYLYVESNKYPTQARNIVQWMCSTY